MQLDLHFWVLLHNLMELFGIQGEHVAVGQRLGSENRREKLLVVADILRCMTTHLQQTEPCVFAGQPAAAASVTLLILGPWSRTQHQQTSTFITSDCSVAEATPACLATDICIQSML